MLGFSLDFWDYVTFAVLIVAGMGSVTVIVLMAGLPGRIAIARNHPDAEAVQWMGFLGFVTVLPWVQAFIWAFKPTDIVDIRRFPREEQRETAAAIARLKGEPELAPPAANDG